MQQDSFIARSAVYDEPRLGLSVPGRLLVRVVSSSFLVLLAVTGVVGLLSDVPQLRGGGILALLFLGDRLLYRASADRRLSALSQAASPNLASLSRFTTS